MSSRCSTCNGRHLLSEDTELPPLKAEQRTDAQTYTDTQAHRHTGKQRYKPEALLSKTPRLLPKNTSPSSNVTSSNRAALNKTCMCLSGKYSVSSPCRPVFQPGSSSTRENKSKDAQHGRKSAGLSHTLSPCSTERAFTLYSSASNTLSARHRLIIEG